MVRMTPVLECWSFSCPIWPVAEGVSFLPVFGSAVPEQTGTLAWSLIGQYVTADDLSISAADPREAGPGYLRDHDADYACGGLRVSDGDVVIDPACCTALDE